MASPFAVFRRNQKIMLAVVGIGAMIAFVFLQPLMDYVGRRQGPQNPVVVETKYGDFKESELAAMRQARELVELFLQRTIAETIDTLIANGQIDPRSRQSNIERSYDLWRRQLMSRTKPGPEGNAIETLILAKRAQDLGMVVSDRAINDLLADLTADSLSSETLRGIVNGLQAGRRVSMARLFEALRTEMLAANLIQLFAASLEDVPPSQKFEYFLRLNRRAKAQIVPLAVVDFTSQVKNPSDDVLRPFYEKYKNRLPNAASPEPGFREPRRAAFQYFKADFAKFTDEMKPEVTDDQIAEYYENNKTQFIALDLPEQPDEKPDEEAPQDESKPADESKEEPADKSKTPPEDPPADKAPADEAKPAEPEKEKAAEEPPSDDGSNEDDEPQPQESSAAPRATLRLVSTAVESEDAPQDENQPDDTTDEPSEAAEKPAEKAQGDTPEKPDEKAKGDAPEKPADESTDKPAQESDEPTESADTPDAAADETPQETKYEPLEKVQDQIRDSIASQKAAERIAEILDLLQADMRNYSDELEIYDTQKGSDPSLQPPAPFPFAELAKKHGVEAKELPLVTAVEAAGEDIGAVYRMIQDRRSQFGFRAEPFAQFAFSESLLTYRPSVVGDNEGNSYLFWKTEEVASAVPKFDKAHDKVLAAWKMIEARPLAHKRAEELAGQARAAKKPLAEVFEGDAGLKVTETDSFSWMTGGSVPLNPMGGGPVRISQIDGVEHIGPAFMESVFDLSAGEIDVAENHPEDTVYVVQLGEYEQPLDELRDEFAHERPALYMAVARPGINAMYLTWIENLEQQADVHWVRRADVARRRGSSAEDTSQF